MLSFWHCSVSKVTLDLKPHDRLEAAGWCRWTDTTARGDPSHCRPQRCGETIRAVTRWWTKIVGLKGLQPFITAFVVAKGSKPGDTVDTHINRKTKCGIFLHHSEHLIEGDVLITGLCYHQLSSASISKTVVNYINCLLSGPWDTASELAPNTGISLLIQVGTRLCPAWSSWYSLHS